MKNKKNKNQKFKQQEKLNEEKIIPKEKKEKKDTDKKRRENKEKKANEAKVKKEKAELDKKAKLEKLEAEKIKKQEEKKSKEEKLIEIQKIKKEKKEKKRSSRSEKKEELKKEKIASKSKKKTMTERKLQFLMKTTSLLTLITMIVIIFIIVLFIQTMTQVDTSARVVLGNYELKIATNFEIKDMTLSSIELRDVEQKATIVLEFGNDTESKYWFLRDEAYTCSLVNENKVSVDVFCEFDDKSKNVEGMEDALSDIINSVIQVRDIELGSVQNDIVEEDFEEELEEEIEDEVEEENVEIIETARIFTNYQIHLLETIESYVVEDVLKFELEEGQFSIKILEDGYLETVYGLKVSVDEAVAEGNTSIKEHGNKEINNNEWYVVNQQLDDTNAKFLCLKYLEEDSAAVVEVIYDLENTTYETYLNSMDEIVETLEEV